MDGQTDSNTSQKTRAEKLCTAAVISLVLGISSFILCLLLDHFVQPYYRSLEDLFALGILLSNAVMYFIAPLLGVIAIKDILSNWYSVTNPDYGSKSEGLIRKIACSFLITGLLFAAISILPSILGISIGNIHDIIDLPAFLKLWLIIIGLMALVMSCISYKLFAKTTIRIRLRVGVIFGIVVSLVVLLAVFLSTSLGYYLIQRIQYSTMPEIPSVDSSSLEQTSIIPTLDSPSSKNKNAIWCSSFQLAWNQMKDDVIGAPIQVVGAEELAARLNAAEQSAADIESRSFYAAAGRVKEGIISKVKKDMAAKFPSHPVPDFNEIARIPRAILAYSYLIANVPFIYPYRQVRSKFIFTDSNGIETNVDAFGVWGHGSQYKRMREQAEILYFHTDSNYQMKEFAVDLCRHSKPYQVVVAVVEPKDSLAQTLDYIHNQIADFKKSDNYKKKRFLYDYDVLKVPEMFWEIDHRFNELIGKIVTNANPPMPILEAKQWIKFKLDRYGSVLESEANIATFASGRDFMLNRPFLVYMKKRDCEQPFFVMWIDNAELLTKK
jgi:hypothetical protein